MRRFVFVFALTVVSVTAAIAQVQDQNRVLPGCPGNSCGGQELSGTWLLAVQRGGQPAPPPVLLFITFDEGGMVTASTGVATQSSHHGVWTRVGNRKFLVTTFLFQFDASGVLTNIVKVRINAVLSRDGQTLNGTQEVVVMAPDGLVLATIPGGTYSGVRLQPEKPDDFDDFLNAQ
jgi:hypothetical protein